MTHRPALRLTAALALATLALAGACGDDSTNGTAASTTEAARSAGAGFPVTLTTPTGAITLSERPDAIVSLSPTGTEMLWAIGADEQVVAVDDQSDFPPDAPRTELSGFQPNIEAIAAYQPDLVVAANDINELVAGLDKLGIPVLLQPAAPDLDAMYAQITDLGRATGNTDAASEVVTEIRDGIEDATAGIDESAPDAEERTYFHEVDPTLYTVTSKTFIGQLYAMFGLKNVADAADDGSGYPQFSAEALFAADPDYIFLADAKCCAQSPVEVAKRPGWDKLSAVREGRVIALDDDVASRWGPRVIELVRAIRGAVTQDAS